MTNDLGYKVEDGWIETWSGKQFYYLDEAPPFDIQDVGHALSKLCRYNGHSRIFYSVAEHCVLLARHAADQGKTAQEQYDLLMHDSVEAYVQDLPRPLKYLPDVQGYKTLEGIIERRMGTHFRYNVGTPLVKEWDSRIIRDERAQVMNISRNAWGTDVLEPLGITIHGWEPVVARINFMQVYNALASELGFQAP